VKLNLLVVTVLGLAGCAKTSDLGHLEDEAQDVADR
jgi:hypothetical protein